VAEKEHSELPRQPEQSQHSNEPEQTKQLAGSIQPEVPQQSEQPEESEQARVAIPFEPELEVLPVLAANLSSKRALDVGANRGDFAAALRMAGFEVDCFEPLPELAEELRHRFSGDPLVRVHEIACSNSGNFARLHEFSASDGNLDTTLYSTLDPHPSYTGLYSDHHTLVQTQRLDAFFPEGKDLQVGLLKIDTEGHDLAVLDGAGEMRPEAIMVEFWHDQFIFNQGRTRNDLFNYRLKIDETHYNHRVLFWRGASASECGVLFDAIAAPHASWGNILFLSDGRAFRVVKEFLEARYGNSPRASSGEGRFSEHGGP
jgi:FkbM family methyltransferase